MKYYPGIQRNAVLAPATTWTKLENITLSKIIQRATHRTRLHLYEMSRTVRPTEIEQVGGCLGWGWVTRMGTEFLLGAIKMFWDLIVGMMAKPVKIIKNTELSTSKGCR